ncbi:39S ribosomal protein L21, mitochondrial [Sitophilus oryzae]|uniref:Large ribosomal subunit protein bL21m n=1 Tax=Sitophilus oryzae TaxID=7048 RepID=A0A6J2YX13_SITOR|nr:39S ribosomal protein L21, mitochondrial [Sitophilus oryzae]
MASLIPKLLNNFSRLALQNSKKLNTRSAQVEKLSSILTKCYGTQATPYEIIDEEKDNKKSDEIIQKVQSQLTESKEGRLFAIVHLAGKQFRITEGDVVVVEGYWPPSCGERISLDKVLLVGASDFTLIGRPVVQNGLVNIEATVIEKTLSHTKTHFRKKRRKQYMRIHFYKIPQTHLRINRISIVGELNNPPEVSGLEKAIF